MNIYSGDNGNLIVQGEMKTIEDYTTMKAALSEEINKGSSDVVIEIKESMTITSSIIGLFTKTVHGDGLKISLLVYSDRLYNLLEDLNLITIFNVKKV